VAQKCDQVVADGRAGMLRGIVAGVWPHNLMFESFQGVRAASLQGLNPAATFTSQAPSNAFPGKATVIGVQVHRR
jgi:hypothetical protein